MGNRNRDYDFYYLDEGADGYEDEFSENDGFWRDLDESADNGLAPEELAEDFGDLLNMLAGLGEHRSFTATSGNDRAHAELLEAGYKWRTNCENNQPSIEQEKAWCCPSGQEQTIDFAICQTAYDCNGGLLPNYVSVWTRESRT